MTKRRGQHEGSIYKRNDGRWAAAVDLGWSDGKRQRKNLYGRTRAEVATKLRKALNDRDSGRPALPERETVESFLRRWLEEVAQQTVRPTTYAGYETAVRLHVIPSLGKNRLARLTPADLNHLYVGLLNEKGLAPRYVRLIHAVLHRAFRQGERWGLIARNPADLLDAPRVPRKEAKYLRTPQIEALFEAARGEPNEALYVLALTTGLRQGELLGLRWADVDVEKRTLQVRQQVQRARGGWVFSEPKTASGRRLVVLPRMAANALKAHRRRQAELRLRMGPAFEDLDLVFPNAVGRPLERQNLMRRSFKPLLAKAGLPDIPFHGLRHSAATLLLSEGVHQRIVQERLGHSSSAITQDLYSHVAPSLQEDAADKIDRLFAAS